MVGLLYALPNTQLTRRLEAEGRLLPLPPSISGDQCTTGLNFVTMRPRRDILADYRAILAAVYEPGAYFRRLRTVCLALAAPAPPRETRAVAARAQSALLCARRLAHDDHRA